MRFWIKRVHLQLFYRFFAMRYNYEKVTILNLLKMSNFMNCEIEYFFYNYITTRPRLPLSSWILLIMSATCKFSWDFEKKIFSFFCIFLSFHPTRWNLFNSLHLFFSHFLMGDFCKEFFWVFFFSFSLFYLATFEL